MIRIVKESTYCVDKQFDSTHHKNWGSFQLNCHRVSLICFPDNRKTRQPWLHVLAEFCLDLWFFLLSESIFLMSTFPSLLQILRDASNFSAKNLFSFAFFKFFELILPTYQGPYSWQHQVQTHATHHLQSDPSWISLQAANHLQPLHLETSLLEACAYTTRKSYVDKGVQLFNKFFGRVHSENVPQSSQCQ